jgi:hypothetical protein
VVELENMWNGPTALLWWTSSWNTACYLNQ